MTQDMKEQHKSVLEKIQKWGNSTEEGIRMKNKKLISNIKTELEWKQELII